jgi:hypothetical protein
MKLTRLPQQKSTAVSAEKIYYRFSENCLPAITVWPNSKTIFDSSTNIHVHKNPEYFQTVIVLWDFIRSYRTLLFPTATQLSAGSARRVLFKELNLWYVKMPLT